VSNRRALILGVAGQDGSYLAEILLARGYDVYGLYRRSSSNNLRRIRHLMGRLTLYEGDLLDMASVASAIRRSDPHEMYNEADQDHVGWSHKTPRTSMDVTAGAVASLLDLVMQFNPSMKVFQPVSSTIFGNNPPLQSETTPHDPRSPYAIAKVAAYHLARHYRRTYGMFIVCGILFNHDSPRRCNEGYLLHELAEQARKVAAGEQERILVGNPLLPVDVGYAREYMEAACTLMQLDEADDYVIGTGQGCLIKDLAWHALQHVGVDPEDKIAVNPHFVRPDKSSALIADTKKIRRACSWQAETQARGVLQMLMEEPCRQ